MKKQFLQRLLPPIGKPRMRPSVGWREWKQRLPFSRVTSFLTALEKGCKSFGALLARLNKNRRTSSCTNRSDQFFFELNDRAWHLEIVCRGSSGNLFLVQCLDQAVFIFYSAADAARYLTECGAPPDCEAFTYLTDSEDASSLFLDS
jgi:hypothetical protein